MILVAVMRRWQKLLLKRIGILRFIQCEVLTSTMWKIFRISHVPEYKLWKFEITVIFLTRNQIMVLKHS